MFREGKLFLFPSAPSRWSKIPAQWYINSERNEHENHWVGPANVVTGIDSCLTIVRHELCLVSGFGGVILNDLYHA
jgi:hypothetical protein